ncbi:YbbR-like domain-containing protein, partial [Streptococcus sp. SPC0]|nr:YbbR-like domain-containing protein [Streptococcus sp. SPC0]
DSISKINYKLSQEKAVISGTKEALEAISVINAEVDISDVTKNTEKKINLSANNVSVDPAQVTVQLTTTKK